MRAVYTLDVDVGTANAIRRALITDLPHVAPDDVVVHVNTTYHTDEYVAHRICMVPFQSVDLGKMASASIVVSDRDVLTRDVECTGIRAVGDGDECILRVAPGQTIDVDITFREDTAATHSRFSRTVAVGMRSLALDKHEISFETLIDDDHDACMRDAMESLHERLRRARDAIV